MSLAVSEAEAVKKGRSSASATGTCIHCGTAFRRSEQRPDFCCAGCQFVHDLISKNGLGHFYDLQEAGVQPVRSLVFHKRDYTWLAELAAAAESNPERSAVLTLDLQGISCIGCVWLVEKLYRRHEGALAIEVDPTIGRIEFCWRPGALDVVAFAQEIQSFGYLIGPPSRGATPAGRSLAVRLGLCGALAMNAMLFTFPGYFGMEPTFELAPLFGKINVAIGTLSMLIGGSYFFVRSWRGLRSRVLHIDLPISAGLLAAYGGSIYAWLHRADGFVYFDFVSIFVFLMLVGRWLQQKAVERNRNQLLSAHADPAPVTLSDSGERLPVAEIQQGAVYVVMPGQLVPVRSVLRSAAGAFGLEWISGESEATVAGRGRVVPSGAVQCGQEPVELEALERWDDSMLASLLKVAPTNTHRNPGLERFIRGYIFVVLALGLGGFLVWYVTTGSFIGALQVLISVLVVSCPCASGIALPLADDLAAVGLRKLGVFVREASLWARLERVRKILFDKTGTLTLETTALTDSSVLQSLSAGERYVLLAMVLDSLHPASCCLRESLLAGGVEPRSGLAVRETVGFGLETHCDGVTWRLGRPEWAVSSDRSDAVASADCVFARDGSPVARFSFCEDVRSDAVDEVAALRKRGCAVFILSGDRRAKVERMAAHLHLPEGCCRGEMSPQEKEEWVRALDDRDTLFVGDGANDSLAFNVAFCTGTPAVDRGLLERKADFYFLGRGLGGVRQLMDAAGARRRTIRRVLAFTICYNAAAIAVSLAGHMSPIAAAILMPASSLVSLAIVFASLRVRA